MAYELNNSMIGDLKQLANELSDRDIKLKQTYKDIVLILNNNNLSDTQKIRKIKKKVSNDD